MAHAPDGVFLSNGPGDPEPCRYAIDLAQALIENRVPLFGICLGHQILALASGAMTEKMKFGHHGANHLFDGTLQGIARTDVPAYSFQGHPEASPGPHDAANLFRPFIVAMESGRQ
jgi:carbamoyl-phosphate synthase small subunit